jgi:hypothetical protein
MAKKLHLTTITVKFRVLDDKPYAYQNVEQLLYDITEGSMLGDITNEKPVSKALNRKAATTASIDLGNIDGSWVDLLYGND